MRRKAVSGITLSLLLIGMLILTFNIRPVKASGTIYIRADGSIEPSTANITTVDNITYTFIGNINDEIVVERDNIVVDGTGYNLHGTGIPYGTGIYLSGRSNATIQNTNIKNFSNGIHLEGSSNNTISGNNITNAGYGIALWGSSNHNSISGNIITVGGLGISHWASSNNTISGNNITNNGAGIGVDESSNNTISGNHITANEHYGISLTGSSNNTLRNNDVRNNGINFEVWGWLLSHYIQDIDDSNTVDGKPVYYWVNRRDMAVPLDAGFVGLVNCTRITVQNLNLTNNGQGILLAFTTNSTITKNNVTDNSKGIWLWESSNCNNISGNSITNNGYGIRFDFSSNNSISGNNITNNYYGIYLIEFSSNNIIYHNNLIDNTRHARCHDSINTWDDGYPSGGNYWSDYTRVDVKSGPNQDQPGSDGIGDTPYVIDENNQDNYPLVLVLGHDLAVSLNTPPYIQLGRSGPLYATVYNRGSSNETEVELQLLINGSRVASVTIPELTSGSSHTLSYLWTPTVEGTYNVTAYVPPVPEEVVITNNVAMRDVSVLTIVGKYISVDPTESTVAVGSTFTINITVINVTNLYTWQIRLYFDNATLNFTDAWLPPDHVFAGKWYIAVEPVIGIDPIGTYVTYGCTLIGDEPTFNGNGTLCQISFAGIAKGSSNLIFSDPRSTFLLDSCLQDILFTVVDGLIVVEELEGDLNLDGRVDMRDISLAAAAFGSYPDHPRWNPIADINEDNKVDMRDIATIAKNFGKTV